MALHRRDLLRLLPASVGVGLLGALQRPVRATGPSPQRRFLFVYVDGGWDPCFVFNPAFDNPYVDMPPDGAALSTSGDLSWVSGPTRPNVDTFFQRYGARTAILNGMEVRSIAHERCRRILLTGTTDVGALDIPSRLAAGAPAHLPLAHLVISGPVYQNAQSDGVVRIGERGQLSALLSGRCVDAADPPLRLPVDDIAALEDDFVRRRVDAAAAAAAPGAPQRLAAAYGAALDDVSAVTDYQQLLSPSGGDSLVELMSAVDLLAAGVSRCAIVHDMGLYNGRWDHHSEITRQSPSYNSLFSNLSQLAQRLESTPGTWAETLLDEITVVVFSEMGRYPSLNPSFGKDHWMTTSLMLFGGGVRGGQVVGAYGEDVNGTPFLPDTGELDPDGSQGGIIPQPANVGATLLALADMDPEEAFGPDVPPLYALIDP